MKFNNKKLLIAFTALILFLAAAYLGYSKIYKPQSYTDVFYGTFSSKVKEGENKAPGQRFNVKVKENTEYPQTGNAQGVVVVNDPTGKHQVLGSPSFVFYTRYDAKNNWYTIIKAEGVMIWGEQ